MMEDNSVIEDLINVCNVRQPQRRIKKMDTGYIVAIGIVALILGGVIGAVGFSSETEVLVPTEIEVPIEVECPALECPAVVDYLAIGVADFMDEYADEDPTCDRDEFDIEEVTISKVYDDYSMEFDGEDYNIEFEVKLKYKEDGEQSCRNNFDVSINYEEGEDPEIDY